MTSINGYVAALKNINPTHLDAALEEAPITSEVQREILQHIWTAQRESTQEEIKASDITFKDAVEFEDGLWLKFYELEGRVTDAFKDSVGLVQEQRITLVVDGKIKHLDPEDRVTLYRSPAEPNEV